MFFMVHSGLPREGPGDDATTRRVLELVDGLPQRPRVLDIGCGPGAQTLVLAAETGGDVTAVDVHQPFLDELQRRARTVGLAGAIHAVRGSMMTLPFDPAAFDLIWSEGAIFIMGFDTGLQAWRSLLTVRGALVVSELTWLSEDAPEPARAFWADAYPGMRTVGENRHAIESNGYECVAEIGLPPESWFPEYLDPLERRIAALSAERPDDAPLQRFLEVERAEIDVVRRYGESFGYVFYVMRKRPTSGRHRRAVTSLVLLASAGKKT
jgi:SAM-dependent methyltransferase